MFCDFLPSFLRNPRIIRTEGANARKPDPLLILNASEKCFYQKFNEFINCLENTDLRFLMRSIGA